jgi:hypothetical protein
MTMDKAVLLGSDNSPLTLRARGAGGYRISGRARAGQGLRPVFQQALSLDPPCSSGDRLPGWPLTRESRSRGVPPGHGHAARPRSSMIDVNIGHTQLHQRHIHTRQARWSTQRGAEAAKTGAAGMMTFPAPGRGQLRTAGLLLLPVRMDGEKGAAITGAAAQICRYSSQPS